MTANGFQTDVHLNPVWKDRANFIIRGAVPSYDRDTRFKYEQIWSRRVGENQFEICCIPFWLYNVNLGDEVRTEDQDGTQYVIAEVLHWSGQYTFRVIFNVQIDEARLEIARRLEGIGCLLEWRNRNFLAISVSARTAQEVANFLHNRQIAGQIIYDTGRMP